MVRKSWNKVPLKTSMHIRILHQEYGMKVGEIMERYPNIPRRTIAYHAKRKQNDESADGRVRNKGRPRILTSRDCRRIKNEIAILREFDTCNFSAGKLQRICDLNEKCSTSTIYRRLKELGYRFMNTRQKGLMSKRDHELRLKFAKKCVAKIGDSLWN